MNKDNLKRYSSYALTYLFWAVSVVVSVWSAYRARDAILSWLVAASLNRYETGAREKFYIGLQFRAAETLSYLFIGLTLIVVIVVLEFVYRTGAQKNQIMQTVSLVMAAQSGVLFLVEVAIVLAESAIHSFAWGDFIPRVIYLLPPRVIYLLPAILFCWLWLSIRPKPAIMQG